MKKLTAKDLLELKHGDTIWKLEEWTGIHKLCELHYVGRNPRNDKFLIFCNGDGGFYANIFIIDNHFHGEYYGGEYDDTFIIKSHLEFYKGQVKRLEKDLSNSIKKELSKRK